MTFLFSLLGVGRHLLGWAQAGVAWLFKDISRVIVAVLLALCLWLYAGKTAETHRADRWHKASQTWQDAHDAVLVANQLATDYALAEKVRIEQEQKEISDAQDITIRSRIADAVARVRDKARAGRAVNADLPETASPAIDTDGAGEGSVGDDTLICVENTVKAQGWQDWYAAVRASLAP